MIKQETWCGAAVYVLENDTFAATVIPSVGSNLFRLYDKKAGRDVLRVPEHLDALTERPVRYGIPILMPPNRIRRGTFVYNGRTYRLEINQPTTGHHIHGLVLKRPWQVVDRKQQDGVVSLTSRFRMSDFPELAEQYPHDLTLEVTYSLSDEGLSQKITAVNRGTDSSPFGFGVHTWFMLDGHPELWTLRVPVSAIWELDEELMPTGRLLPTGKFAALNEGLNLAGQNLDTVFQIGNAPAEAVLAKPGYSIRYAAKGPFKQWVFYTMGDARDYICLEPYTWVSNAPNLDLDPETTGFRALAPGEILEMEIDMLITKGEPQ